VGLKYALDASEGDDGLLAQGDVLMGAWRGGSVGLAACAAAEAAAPAATAATAASNGGVAAAGSAAGGGEATVEGMVRCRFDAGHKLLAVELTFDAASFSRQLQKLGLADASRLGATSHRGKSSGSKTGGSSAAGVAGAGSGLGSAGGTSAAGLLAPLGTAGLLKPAPVSRSSSGTPSGARPNALPLPPLAALGCAGVPGLHPAGGLGAFLLAPAFGPGSSGGGPPGPLPSAAFMRDFARATQLARAACGHHAPSPQQVHLQLLALQMQAMAAALADTTAGVQAAADATAPDGRSGAPASSSADSAVHAAAAKRPAPSPPPASTEVGPSGGESAANAAKKLKAVTPSQGAAVATPSPPGAAWGFPITARAGALPGASFSPPTLPCGPSSSGGSSAAAGAQPLTHADDGSGALSSFQVAQVGALLGPNHSAF
jgi:hypothetical protein